MPKKKRYSVGETRDRFDAIIAKLETSEAVEIVSNGAVVAVLLSKQNYDRLVSVEHSETGTASSFFRDRYEAFRKEHNLDELGIDTDEVFGHIRKSET